MTQLLLNDAYEAAQTTIEEELAELFQEPMGEE